MRVSLPVFLRFPWCVPVVFFGLFVLASQSVVRTSYEDVLYRVDPTAQRAFDIAERSFSATDPEHYDFERSEHYFLEAVRLDPKMPYLYHELARISFLRGDFATAYARISYEISQHGDTQPRSYYIRGLIEGYMKLYTKAVDDFGHFLSLQPGSWAGANDFAWVLIKAERPLDAERVTTQALATFPNNPWLLNSNAIALSELGRTDEARVQIAKAAQMSLQVTQADWLYAYPGNDPRVAHEGILALQDSVLHTMHVLNSRSELSRLQ